MTIEQKAKAYDKAINAIKELKAKHPTAHVIKDWIKENFPELAESEDEQIRKFIVTAIENLKIIDNEDRNSLCNKALAWLEKQDEQSICKTPSREIILAIWDLGNEWKELTNGSISTEHGTQLDYVQKHWQESEYYLRAKQVEYKPADKVEPKFKIGDTIKCKYDDRQFTIKSVDLDKGKYTYTQEGCGNDIDYADEEFELVEQKPAWSEEDEKMIDGIIEASIHHCYLNITDIEWLKSLKDRVQPQNKWKESLATADLENSLCDIQDGFSDTSYEYRILGKAIEFIRCTEPKPQWKPSDEQIEVLKSMINFVDMTTSFDAYSFRIVESLYEQLKKLRL